MSRFKPSSTAWAQPPALDTGRTLARKPSPAFPSRAAVPAATPDPAPAAAPPAPTRRRDFAWDADANNSLREFGFLFALAYVFTRFSMINQLIEFKVGLNTYMTYLFGIPAIILMVATGGAQRVFRSKAAILFIGFMLWMTLAAPFSVWRGGSFKLLKDSFLIEFPLLFLIAGLAVTRANIERIFRAIALSVTLMVISAFLFGTTWGDRLALMFGSVANPNDLATHILTTLPFVVWAIISNKSTISITRFFWIATAIGAMIVVVKTGSRGGLLAFALMMLITLFRVPVAQRILIIGSSVVVLAATLALAPGVIVQRYMSMFGGAPSEEYLDEEQLVMARGSSEARKNLLLASLKITLQNPILGVGPGQFSVAEDDEQKRKGLARGAWQVTHNSYTEVSSENGIPALLFFVGSILTSLLGLNRLVRSRTADPDAKRIALCLFLSIVACSVCLFFASLAYRFYIPALVGLTAVVIRWAQVSETTRAVPSAAGGTGSR